MAAPIANPMTHTDGTMTFDWIFFAIVVIPMVYMIWELFKTNAALTKMSAKQR